MAASSMTQSYSPQTCIVIRVKWWPHFISIAIISTIIIIIIVVVVIIVNFQSSLLEDFFCARRVCQ